ncbi:MAG: hypothetical protein M3071_23510 [Actinomycetota bacterium]|nr:hypothetical protein [Actinomycetota bacterium]
MSPHLAILGSLMLHSTIWGAMPSVLPGGNLGVTVFLGLSGFLITTLLFGEHERGGADRSSLVPCAPHGAAAAGLLVLLPVYVIVSSHQQSAWQLVLLVGPVLLYLSRFVQAIWGAIGPLAWTWSLSVEEHFYACWPPDRGSISTARSAGTHSPTTRPPRGWMRLQSGASLRFSHVATAGHCRASPAPRPRGHRLVRRQPGLHHRHGLPQPLRPAPLRGRRRRAHRERGQPAQGLLARALSLPPLAHLGVVAYGLYLWRLGAPRGRVAWEGEA